jgi:hypothetical protein
VTNTPPTDPDGRAPAPRTTFSDGGGANFIVDVALFFVASCATSFSFDKQQSGAKPAPVK